MEEKEEELKKKITFLKKEIIQLSYVNTLEAVVKNEEELIPLEQDYRDVVLKKYRTMESKYVKHREVISKRLEDFKSSVSKINDDGRRKEIEDDMSKIIEDLRSTEDYITKMVAVAPAAPGTAAPQWDKFLQRVTGGDLELQSYLQRMAGYCLTGDTREHALFFIYGPGGNGKSVFLNTLNGILADYAETAVMDAFAASAHDKHSTDIAMLRGARGSSGRLYWQMLLGFPPLAGFAGKFQVFVAVYDAARNAPGSLGTWLYAFLAVGAVNTALSAVYYLKVVRAMALDQLVRSS